MHTPGPWLYGSHVIETPSGYTVLAIGKDGTEMKVDDARLIAAAPKLLAALKLAASIIGDPNNAGMDVIHAAINDAEGRT